MKDTFSTLRTEITARIAECDKELATIEARASELRTDRTKLRNSLKALGAESDASDQKRAPKQPDVRAALSELLAENPGGIDRVDLEALLSEQLASKHQCSAVGLALRIKELLASGKFVEEEGVIRTALSVMASI